MDTKLRTQLLSGLTNGSIVPYLGPGVLADVRSPTTGAPMPATSNELLLAMNGGKPLSARPMFEFSRAAMDLELRSGRLALTRFLEVTYGRMPWKRSAIHEWLTTIRPAYVVDVNRDRQLIDSYSGIPHLLVLGCSRIVSRGFRYQLYHHDGSRYTAIDTRQAANSPQLPVLFKPMGAPLPEPSFIATDADCMDYITGLMGGLAIPSFVKPLRRDKRYLLLGMRLTNDTDRMILNGLIESAAEFPGWALIDKPTDVERRVLNKMGIEVIEESLQALLVEHERLAA